MTAEQAFGERLRAARQERGWSQQALANWMTTAGFSWHQTTVAKTESADRPAMLREAIHLAALLSLDLNSLIDVFVCQACAGQPPHGFTCNECGAKAA